MSTETKNTDNIETSTDNVMPYEWWQQLDEVKDSLETIGAMLDDVSKQNREAIDYLNNTPMIRVSNAAKALFGSKR